MTILGFSLCPGDSDFLLSLRNYSVCCHESDE